MEFNETWQESRSKRPLPRFVFFGPIGKTRWPPWPLIGRDIFNFSSETAEPNSMKLDRKQDLNTFYQVCVFWADRKNKMANLASDWLRHFRLLFWNCERNLTKLDRKQDLNALYQVCIFQVDRKNKMAALAYDLLRHFRLLLWNRWMAKLDRKQSLNAFYHVCVFQANREKTKWLPWPLIGWDIFEFSSETVEWIWRNLIGSKISTPSTKFVFFRWIGKTKWPPWPMICWDIFNFSSETAE